MSTPAERLADLRDRFGFTWPPGMRLRVFGGDREWFRVQDGTCHSGRLEADIRDQVTAIAVLTLVRRVWDGFTVEVTINPDGGGVVRIYHPGMHLADVFRDEDDVAVALIKAMEGAT